MYCVTRDNLYCVLCAPTINTFVYHWLLDWVTLVSHITIVLLVFLIVGETTMFLGTQGGVVSLTPDWKLRLLSILH